jgi:hypothetical protein
VLKVLFSNYINTKEGKKMIPSHNVFASLRRSVPHLAHDHEAIVRGMMADGLCSADAGDAVSAAAVRGAGILSLNAAAADPMKTRLVRQAVSMAQSIGVTLKADTAIDPFALSADLKAAGASSDQRWRLKTALAQIGCLA